MKVIVLALLLVPALSFGLDPGKNGDRLVTTANTVVNQYAEIAVDANAGAFSIEVTDINDLGSPEAVGGGPIAPGDLILIYQARGATVDESADHNYGTITDYGNAGRYEIRSVAAVSGNTLDVEPVDDGVSCVGLRFNFTTFGRAQVVRIPQYRNLAVQAGSSIVAQTWNGRVGGIVGFFVDQELTLDGVVHADAAGFRGGLTENSDRASTGLSPVTFRSNQNPSGGHKGEGIASGDGHTFNSIAFPFSNPAGNFDEAAPANGGGGGGSHNAGGGGGGNVAPSVTPYCVADVATYDTTNPAINWCGQGVMPGGITGEIAWTLDPAYLANGNSLTAHVGGGRGGYTFSFTNADATIDAPGGGAWGNDQRRAKGGWGGRPLDFDATERVFFGGGGGAGGMNNAAGGSGGGGGGLVLIRATIVSGSGEIRAHGGAGGNTMSGHNDGPGGGGAGGSILIEAVGGSFSGTIGANGGNGGNQLITNAESEGPGGGGGGGLVAATGIASATLEANGGEGGTTNSASLTEFPRNGSTDGHPGVTNTATLSVSNAICELNPALTQLKTGTLNDNDGIAGVSAGDTISYAFTVENTGNVPLTNVMLSDPQVTVAGGPIASLAVGATDATTFTATYTLTQADIDAGTFTNIATASSDEGAADDDSDTQLLAQDPVLTLVKVVDAGSPYSAVGDVIDYTLTATNAGNVTLDNIVISDPEATIGACTPGQPASLVPGAQLVCEASYIVTQADLDAGMFTNTASVDGDDPNGAPVDDSAVAVATAVQTPALVTAKSLTGNDDADVSGTVSLGDTLTYTITATNTGNVTLSNVEVTDDLISPASETCATLAVGADCVLIGSYTVTQADVDEGRIVNTGSATSTQIPDPVEDEVTTSIIKLPSLMVVKNSFPASGSNVTPGQTISYTITATVSDAALSADLALEDTLGEGLTFGTLVNLDGFTANTNGNPLAFTLPSGTLPGIYEVSYAAGVDNDATGKVGNNVVVTGDGGDPDPECPSCLTEHPLDEPRPPQDAIPVPVNKRLALIWLAMLVMLAGLNATRRMSLRDR